jgi:hypothetical protein
MKNKLGEENVKQLHEIITESIQWLDEHQNDTKEDYDTKLKEIEGKTKPILMTMYQNGNNAQNTQN